jgi:hypothetical protein
MASTVWSRDDEESETNDEELRSSGGALTFHNASITDVGGTESRFNTRGQPFPFGTEERETTDGHGCTRIRIHHQGRKDTKREKEE